PGDRRQGARNMRLKHDGVGYLDIADDIGSHGTLQALTGESVASRRGTATGFAAPADDSAAPDPPDIAGRKQVAGLVPQLVRLGFLLSFICVRPLQPTRH